MSFPIDNSIVDLLGFDNLIVNMEEKVLDNHVTALAAIVQTIPLLFHRLRAIGDALHAEHGVTTPMRGVMQSLIKGEPKTVPELAAMRPVSRQHIQTQVDALARCGFVRSVPNPAHKRSSFVALTDSGRRLFETMQKKEIEVLTGIVGAFLSSDLDVTAHTLMKLAEKVAVLLDNLENPGHDG